MNNSKFEHDITKYLTAKFNKYTYITGVNPNKRGRKKVSHSKGSLQNTLRGKSNATRRGAARTTNDKIIFYLYDQGFYFYSSSFKPSSPNYNTFLKSIQYLLDDNPRRFENAITANVKAYLDKQMERSNKPSTIKSKKFDRFGIDSRQFQLSLDTTSSPDRNKKVRRVKKNN